MEKKRKKKMSSGWICPEKQSKPASKRKAQVLFCSRLVLLTPTLAVLFPSLQYTKRIFSTSHSQSNILEERKEKKKKNFPQDNQLSTNQYENKSQHTTDPVIH